MEDPEVDNRHQVNEQDIRTHTVAVLVTEEGCMEVEVTQQVVVSEDRQPEATQQQVEEDGIQPHWVGVTVGEPEVTRQLLVTVEELVAEEDIPRYLEVLVTVEEQLVMEVTPPPLVEEEDIPQAVLHKPVVMELGHMELVTHQQVEEEEDIHPLQQLEGLVVTEEEDEEGPMLGQVDHQEEHSKGQPGLDRLSMNSRPLMANH